RTKEPAYDARQAEQLTTAHVSLARRPGVSRPVQQAKILLRQRQYLVAAKADATRDRKNVCRRHVLFVHAVVANELLRHGWRRVAFAGPPAEGPERKSG